MLDPVNDMMPPPSSPSISSVSSSDLDTESTGSFFHDRSTTLGTLMGVSFPSIAFRAPSQHRDPHASASVSVSTVSRKTKKARKNKSNAQPPFAMVERRRKWWQICRDDEAVPASLGEFLEVERRFGDGAFFGAAAELEGVEVVQQHQRNGHMLFADGRVLPPAAADGDDGSSTAGALCRFPVSLTGICSGGVG
ncbi:hypothetical protein I3760_16G097000 [Carya illinoinensis]|nr:hypothetical protein I3760_16G097000 [Carya illinoinensis]KAG2664721.1 hypothetical protein I3760_16G097000 [Carya illinoinensis]